MSMQREEATVIGLDAVGAARLADNLLRDGETLQSVWRYVIVQLLDDYSHDLARAGAVVASRRFSHEPPATRSTEVDAAFAALAEYLARRGRSGGAAPRRTGLPGWGDRLRRGGDQAVELAERGSPGLDRAAAATGSARIASTGSVRDFGVPAR